MFSKLVDFFRPPVFDNFERSQKAAFLHVSLIITSVTCVLLGFQNTNGQTDLDLYLFILGAISFVCIAINKRGYYIPTALFISALILVLLTFSLIDGVSLMDAGLLAYPIFIIFSSFLFSKRAALVTAFLSMLSVLLVYYLEITDQLVPSVYDSDAQLRVILILLAAIGFFLWAVTNSWGQILNNLRSTYDLTLSGWSKALEYRDQETEGHSQRVTALTVELARRLGVSSREQQYIRRGAILHDIGKMAIPDSILHKPDSLTEDEWIVVRKHPTFAREMIEGIPFLKPSIDIPYYHHERWDGTGYPEGLAAEEIPLAARIFAVIDVWDALISERPYRQGWPHDKARNYIQEQAGKLFDPHIVDIFLEMVPEE